MKNHRWWSASLVCLGAALILAASSKGAHAQQTFAESNCLSVCTMQCLLPYMHENYNGGDDNNQAVEPHGCENGESCQHRVCDDAGFALNGPIGAEEAANMLQRLRVAVAEDDYATVGALRERLPARIEFNFLRGAVQVKGCDGLVSDHYPMPTEILAAISRETHVAAVSASQIR